MQNRWIAGVALTLALTLGGTVLSAPAADKGDQELKALITKIAQAWESMDISKVDPFYAKDADLAFFDIAPLKYANWAEYRTGVQKAFFEPNKSLKFTLNDDVKTHRHRSLAWATFTFGADVVDKKDAKSHLDGRWTMILEQRKGNWTVIHEHVSVPLAG
jgi:ketosteroid isomerase-like protein